MLTLGVFASEGPVERQKLLFLGIGLEPMDFIRLLKVGHLYIIIRLKMKISSLQMGNNNGSEKLFLRGKYSQ